MSPFAKTLLIAVSIALCLLAAALPAPARADHPSVGLGSGVAGPIVTIPAATLPAGKWTASFRVEWITFKTFSDSELVLLAENGTEAHSTKNVVSPSLSVAHGVTPTLTVGARLPYVTRRDIREGHLEGTTAEAHHHGDSRGIGDLTVLGEFLVWSRPSAKIALLTGIKAPTGRTTAGGDERLETEHQPGSGSWDFLEGIAWSARLPFGSFDANLLATFASEGAMETNLGTLLNYNAALSGKISGGVEHPHAEGERARPHVHRHGEDHVGADVILELNGESRSKVKIGGVEDPNSGGNLMYLSPGLRFGSQRWSVSTSVGFPLFQDVNGTQHETDWRLLAGFGMSF